ncbi:hypothetical protein Tco_1160320 [Tanacetum coccineum]
MLRSSSIIRIFRPSGLVTRDIATYSCPWLNTRLGKTSVEALQTLSALLYVIVGPGNLSNIYAFIASASSFLGVRIARSFRYAPSLCLVVKSRNVSFTICSIGDFVALIMKSSGISI